MNNKRCAVNYGRLTPIVSGKLQSAIKISMNNPFSYARGSTKRLLSPSVVRETIGCKRLASISWLVDIMFPACGVV